MDAPKPSLYRHRFGNAEFDEAHFELRVGGLVVDVQQKPLRLLALLLATPGEVVAKDVIFEKVWNKRATGDAVLANAVSKLRNALGPTDAERIVTVPRQGYRLLGPVERTAVGRALASRMAFEAGAPVPGREHFTLQRLLGASPRSEAWLARHAKTGELRVYKFAVDGERLADLKREVTVYRVLRDSLGERDDFARILDWQFDAPPHFIECAYGGASLAAWAAEPDGASTRLATAGPALRLALALQIVDAVAAAHSVGVLHKDLKPANVLIEPHGPGWQLRLTDFGSARLLDPERLERLRITQLGLTVSHDAGSEPSSGTPFYVAPELLAGGAPTVRSDVYALGVMLYQLLAGDLRRLMGTGWQRDIDDELLREDVARATDVEPERRPPSAAELATSLRELEARRERRASERATEAQAQAAEAARARRRARRPWTIAAAVALLLGSASSLALYLAERRANSALTQQLQLTGALNRLLREDLIAAANPAAAGRADVTVAQALKAAAAAVDTRFAGQPPAVRASLHQAMQNAFSELSQAQDSVAAGRSAVAAYLQAEPRDIEALQNARLRLALDLAQLSQNDEARALLADIEHDAGPPAAQAPALRARLLFVKSWLVPGGLELQESLAPLREAWELARPYTEAQLPWHDKIEFALADTLTMLGQHSEAEALLRDLLAAQTAALGVGHVRTFVTMVGLGKVLANQQRRAEAEQVLTEAAQGLNTKLGPAHRMSLDTLGLLAELHYAAGNTARAAEEWQRAHQGFTALLGAGSSYTLTMQTNLGMAQHRLGHLAEAEATLRSTLGLVRAIVKDQEPQAQQVRYALADCLLDQGRAAEAAPLLEGLDATALNLAQQEPDWPARLERQRARLAAPQAALARR